MKPLLPQDASCSLSPGLPPIVRQPGLLIDMGRVTAEPAEKNCPNFGSLASQSQWPLRSTPPSRTSVATQQSSWQVTDASPKPAESVRPDRWLLNPAYRPRSDWSPPAVPLRQ